MRSPLFKDGGLEVKLVDHDTETFIKRSDLVAASSRRAAPRSASPSARRSMRASSRSTRRPGKSRCSIKALEIAEEKEAVAQQTARPIPALRLR